MRRGAFRLGAMMLVAAVCVACGKKGPPLPPLRPVPGRIVDLTARLTADRVTLRFTVPAENADQTTPPAAGRVDIYRAAGTVVAEGAPRPTANSMIVPENLVASLDLAVSAPSGAAGVPETGAETGAGAAPTPGQTATWVDAIRPADTTAPSSADPASTVPAAEPVWRYVVVAVAGRDRRGAPSNVVDVPLGETVAAVSDLAIDYDAETLRLSWSASAEGTKFDVVELDAPGGTPRTLTPAPIEETEYRVPVEFGRSRCYAVRAVLVAGATTIDAPLGVPVCDAPIDTFPPPPPEGLVAVQEGAVVVLRWRATASADLGGYVVLRGDGAGETLRPLVTAPVTGTTYRDTTAVAGATYTYVVVAVDRMTPPNTSGQSSRETVIVR